MQYFNLISPRLLRRVTALLTLLVISPVMRAATYAGTALYPYSSPAGITSGDVTFGTYPNIASTATAGYGFTSSNTGNALLWSGPSGAVTNLQPTNLSFTESFALATDGTQEGGYGNIGSQQHALLWSGTAASAVDLNPTNLGPVTVSNVHGVGNSLQIGEAFVASGSHAILWSGTASSAVDLNPVNLPQLTTSYGNGIGGGREVGAGFVSSYAPHALLWNGTAASAVDLNPTNLPGVIYSAAFGTNETQQVGTGYMSSSDGQGVGQALLWNGAAASAVNLEPTNLTGFSNSIAMATNGTEQVGYGDGSGTKYAYHALAWSGTASSTIDLQALLPASGSWTSSEATSIDSSGNIYGEAAGTLNGVTGNFAVEWSTPEPATLLLAALIPWMSGRYGRRRSMP